MARRLHFPSSFISSAFFHPGPHLEMDVNCTGRLCPGRAEPCRGMASAPFSMHSLLTQRSFSHLSSRFLCAAFGTGAANSMCAALAAGAERHTLCHQALHSHIQIKPGPTSSLHTMGSHSLELLTPHPSSLSSISDHTPLSYCPFSLPRFCPPGCVCWECPLLQCT